MTVDNQDSYTKPVLVTYFNLDITTNIASFKYIRNR